MADEKPPPVYYVITHRCHTQPVGYQPLWITYIRILFSKHCEHRNETIKQTDSDFQD